MKKNIAIVILLLATVSSVAYALYQKTEAERYMMDALKNEILAHENASMAVKERHVAEAHAMEAMRQNQIANEALEKCKKSK